MWKSIENGPFFPKRLLPDWVYAARAAMAGLGYIGLNLLASGSNYFRNVNTSGSNFVQVYSLEICLTNLCM